MKDKAIVWKLIGMIVLFFVLARINKELGTREGIFLILYALFMAAWLLLEKHRIRMVVYRQK